MEWYYVINDQRQGPVELDALKDLVANGTLTDNCLVWNNTMGDTWVKVADVPALGGMKSADDDPVAKEEF